MDEKPDKRATDGSKVSLSAIPAPPLHSRKAPPRSPTPSTSYSKALTPLSVAPLPSPVAAMKSEDRPKPQKALPQQPYSHPSSPIPHPVRPASASPPAASPIQPKEEPEKESLSLQKQASAPFPSMYSGKCLATFPKCTVVMFLCVLWDSSKTRRKSVYHAQPLITLVLFWGVSLGRGRESTQDTHQRQCTVLVVRMCRLNETSADILTYGITSCHFTRIETSMIAGPFVPTFPFKMSE